PKRCAHRRRARGTSCISVIGCGSDWVSSCAGWGVRRIHGHRSFMDIAAIYLVAALAAGGLALVVKLPPLVGFLVAGFGLNAAGVEQMPGLQTLADLGVTLLLFGIGLKLDLRSLVKARVWATAVAHMGFSVLVALAMLVAIAPLGFAVVSGADVGELAVVALALSFSSTVFVVKVLDERRDNQTLYGRIAVGVLIMQDIVAVVVLTVSKGK